MMQIVIGSALSVVSVLPMFFEKGFGVTPAIAGFAATAYSIMNLVTRPMGGFLLAGMGMRMFYLCSKFVPFQESLYVVDL